MTRIFQVLIIAVIGGLLGTSFNAFGINTSNADSGTDPGQTASADPSSGSSMAKQSASDENGTAPFAFVELFTSEGCSSCPSADANLKQIAAEASQSGKNVYTLSYHVDYWDYLGWQDPYSSREFSDRQREYSRRSRRVYTPQMIVNGRTEFVGSNMKKAEDAVDRALKSQPKATISVECAMQNGIINAQWKVEGLGKGDQVQVALVQNSGEQDVSRGENANRKLSHVNIVRQLETVSNPAGEGATELSVPEGFAADKFHVVAFVQSLTGVKAAGKGSIVAKMGGNDKANNMAASKTAMPAEKQIESKLLSELHFLEMSQGERGRFTAGLRAVEDKWHISYVPMLLESGRFMRPRSLNDITRLVSKKTGQQFGNDLDKWLEWMWKQEIKPHPGYANFKSLLYGNIDRRFSEYFEVTKDSRIRLDEIRWGGVKRDGIPPLKDPKMLTANNAGYLADTDVVFGIELNGDARAYPKRILAWHEMFKDTIGGESVCGVY